jgi:hypothetical protein
MHGASSPLAEPLALEKWDRLHRERARERATRAAFALKR